MAACPNKNLKAWKDLTSQYGEVGAMFMYTVEKDIPTAKRAQELALQYELVEGDSLTSPAARIKPGVPELFDSDPELANQVYEALVPKGYTRLYRAENEKGVDSPAPTWLLEQPEIKEQQKAQGRWFYKSYEEAKYHSEKFGSSGITYIDIPTNQIESFNAKNNKFGGGYAKDGKEYFVSKELSDTRKYFKQQKQQALQLYSQYLDIIFPDSKIKDIVYHGTDNNKLDSFIENLRSGIHFGTMEQAKGRRIATDTEFKRDFKFIPVLLNLKNPLRSKDFDWEKSGDAFSYWTPDVDLSDVDFTEYLLTSNIATANDIQNSEGDFDIINKKGYDGVVYKNEGAGENTGEDSFAVSKPEQIHVLGSKKDIEGFKEFVNSKNIQYKKDTSTGIEIVEPKKSLALGKGSTTELDLAIRSYMLENPDATTEQVVEHLALSGIINLDCSNTGSIKAKDGLTDSVSGTGWSIVKDFKGKPKHSQGGYDITIKDDGFYMGDIKAENGLVIVNQDPIYKTKLTDQEEKQFKDWYNKVSKYKNLDPNPDSEEQYYDYRGYWKNENRDDILKENTEAHFIDRYKVPGHPTFSNESMYSNDKTPGGSWSTGKDGTWYFTHSPYTVKYSDRTAEYLDGTGEFSIIGQDTIRNPNDYFRAINKLKTNKP